MLGLSEPLGLTLDEILFDTEAEIEADILALGLWEADGLLEIDAEMLLDMLALGL